MSSVPNRLVIRSFCIQEILAHVTGCLPEEACGLLGGVVREETVSVEVVQQVENELHSPVRFRMAPAEQLKAFYALEERGLELAAIFHSHPTGPDHLSITDLTEFAYPGVLMLICSPAAVPGGLNSLASPAWQIRAFRVDGVLSADSTVVEVPIKVVPDSIQNPALGL